MPKLAETVEIAKAWRARKSLINTREAIVILRVPTHIYIIELLKFTSMFECEVNIVTKTFRTIIRERFRNEVGL